MRRFAVALVAMLLITPVFGQGRNNPDPSQQLPDCPVPIGPCPQQNYHCVDTTGQMSQDSILRCKSGLWTSVGGGAQNIAEDAVGTTELNDGLDSPIAGQCVTVDADTSRFTYAACGTGGGLESVVELHAESTGSGTDLDPWLGWETSLSAGGTFLLRPGIFEVRQTGNVSIPSNTLIQCEPGASIRLPDPYTLATPLFYLNGSDNVTIDGCFFDTGRVPDPINGDPDGSSRWLTLQNGNDAIRITNNKFGPCIIESTPRSDTTYAMLMYADVTHLTVEGNEFDFCNYGLFFRDNDGGSFDFIRIDNNTFSYSQNQGPSDVWEPVISTYRAGGTARNFERHHSWSITNNHLRGAGSAGIHVLSPILGLTIADNNFHVGDNGTDFNIKVDNYNVSTGERSLGVNITGNTGVQTATTAGVADIFVGGAEQVVVSGNISHVIGVHPCIAFGNVNGFVMSSNQCTIGTSAENVAVWQFGALPVTNGTVIGNSAINPHSRAFDFYAGSSAENIIFAYNTVIDETGGMTEGLVANGSCSNCSIVGNTIIDDGTTPWTTTEAIPWVYDVGNRGGTRSSGSFQLRNPIQMSDLSITEHPDSTGPQNWVLPRDAPTATSQVLTASTDESQLFWRDPGLVADAWSMTFPSSPVDDAGDTHLSPAVLLSTPHSSSNSATYSFSGATPLTGRAQVWLYPGRGGPSGNCGVAPGEYTTFLVEWWDGDSWELACSFQQSGTDLVTPWRSCLGDPTTIAMDTLQVKITVDATSQNDGACRANIGLVAFNEGSFTLRQSEDQIEKMDLAIGRGLDEDTSLIYRQGTGNDPRLLWDDSASSFEFDFDNVPADGTNPTVTSSAFVGNLTGQASAHFTKAELQAGPCNGTTEFQHGVDTDGSPLCDEITATNLASACTDAQVLGGTSTPGGVECQTDDIGTDDQAASEVGYTVGDAADWTDPDPTFVNAALDALADRMVAVEGGGTPVCSTTGGAWLCDTDDDAVTDWAYVGDYDNDSVLEMSDIDTVAGLMTAGGIIVVAPGDYDPGDNQTNSNGLIELSTGTTLQCSKGAKLNGPAIYVGTATGTSSTVLTVGSPTFPDSALIGWLAYSATENKSCTITSNNTTSVTCTTSTITDFTGDEYFVVRDSPALSVVSNATTNSDTDISVIGCEIDGGMPPTDYNITGDPGYARSGISLLGVKRWLVQGNYIHDTRHTGIYAKNSSDGKALANDVLRVGNWPIADGGGGGAGYPCFYLYADVTHTGTTESSGSSTDMYDAGATFPLLDDGSGGLVGHYILNTTDSSACLITSNTVDTIVCSGGLSGSNTWDNTEGYSVGGRSSRNTYSDNTCYAYGSGGLSTRIQTTLSRIDSFIFSRNIIRGLNDSDASECLSVSGVEGGHYADVQCLNTGIVNFQNGTGGYYNEGNGGIRAHTTNTKNVLVDGLYMEGCNGTCVNIGAYHEDATIRNLKVVEPDADSECIVVANPVRHALFENIQCLGLNYSAGTFVAGFRTSNAQTVANYDEQITVRDLTVTHSGTNSVGVRLGGATRGFVLDGARFWNDAASATQGGIVVAGVATNLSISNVTCDMAAQNNQCLRFLSAANGSAHVRVSNLSIENAGTTGYGIRWETGSGASDVSLANIAAYGPAAAGVGGAVWGSSTATTGKASNVSCTNESSNGCFIVGANDTWEFDRVDDQITAAEDVMRVINKSGATLYRCTPVYISGYDATTDLPTIAIADADNASAMPAVGLVHTTMNNNAKGYVKTGGVLYDVDTVTGEVWSVGDPVYISTSGAAASADCGNALTKTRPTASGTAVQRMGVVVRVNATLGIVNVSGAGRSNDISNLGEDAVAVGDTGGSAGYIAASLANGALSYDTSADTFSQADLADLSGTGTITNTYYCTANGTTSLACNTNPTSVVETTDTDVVDVGMIDSANSPTEGLLAAPNDSADGQFAFRNPPAMCKTLWNSGGLADTDDIGTWYRWSDAVYIEEVWCETDAGTATITLTHSTAGALLSSQNCTTAGDSYTGTLTNRAIAASEQLDFTMVTANAGSRLTVCWEFRYD